MVTLTPGPPSNSLFWTLVLLVGVVGVVTATGELPWSTPEQVLEHPGVVQDFTPETPRPTDISIVSRSNLCHAQCMARCLDSMQTQFGFTIGPTDTDQDRDSKDEECAERCDRYQSTEWVEHCQRNATCLEMCHNLRNHTTPGTAPPSPEVVLWQVNPGEVQLSWQACTVDSTVFYVIESSDDIGQSWDYVTKTSNLTVTLPLHVCARRHYRVAAVSGYGSNGFKPQSTVIRSKLPKPGPVRGMEVITTMFDPEIKYFYVLVRWDPPLGWSPDQVQDYNVFTEMTKDCEGDNIIPSVPVVDDLRQISSDNTTMVAKIRIFYMGYGCIYTTPVSASSKCGEVGEPLNLDIDLRDCNELVNFDCPVKNPYGPGAVYNATWQLNNETLGVTITWLPPLDLGTYGRVDVYYVQWGVLSQGTEPYSPLVEIGMIRLPGNAMESDIFVNSTSVRYGVKIVATVREIQVNEYDFLIRTVDVTFRIDEHKEYGGNDKGGRSTDTAVTANTGSGAPSHLQKVYLGVPLGVAAVLVVVVFSLVHQRVRLRRAQTAASRPENLCRLSDKSGNRAYLVDNPLYSSSDPWDIPRHRLRLGEVLGKGAFGQVVFGELLPATPGQETPTGGEGSAVQTSTKVAVKMLFEGADESLTADFEREIALMKTLGAHPNVVSMVGCCTQTAPLCLVVEHMQTDLLHYLRHRRHAGTVNVPEDDLLCLKDLFSFGHQVAVGMEYLSQRRFVHRDLAARNVLVGHRKSAKIGDFGLTRYVYDDHVYVTRRGKRLPLKWMALEAIFDLVFTTQTDVWAYGVLLYELMTLGGVPYPTVSNKVLLRRLQAGYRLERPDTCPSSLYDVMLSCWRRDPASRPSFTELSARLEQLMTRETTNDYITIREPRDEQHPDEDDLTSDEENDVVVDEVTGDVHVRMYHDDEDKGSDEVFAQGTDVGSASSCSSRGYQTSDSSGVSSGVSTCPSGSNFPTFTDQIILAPSTAGQCQLPLRCRSRSHGGQDEPESVRSHGREVGKWQDAARISTCSQDRLLSSSFSEGFCSDDGLAAGIVAAPSGMPAVSAGYGMSLSIC